MRALLRNKRGTCVARRHALRLVHRPGVETLDRRCLLDGAIGYTQTALASDLPGVAPHTDPDLLNPWGFSETEDGQFRISANGAGNAPLLTARGVEIGQAIVIPTPAGSPAGSTSTPNGNITNSTHDFVISENGKSAPATVLFSTEDGTIAAWNPKVDRKNAVIAADQSGNGAIYKLLAMGSATVGGTTQNFLYATNFHNGTVDVFDKNFKLVHLDGSFTDSNLPAGFAPFGIKNINGTLFVSYAKQDADKEDDVEGVGNGFIDEFDTSGHFLKRFASQGTLDSPIGMAIAPSDFGEFSNALLVGNFGNSRVNAFDMNTGKFLGQLSDASGNPLTLNGGATSSSTKGLWGIGFGNGADGASKNALFFATGINDEKDGVFGKVTANNHEIVRPGLVIKQPNFYEHYVGPKLPELNAVAAAVDLLPSGNFLMIGVNQGRIDPNTLASFVFGIDRNGNLPPGPFPDRPGIRFDALVVLKIVPGSPMSASVIDMANHTTTALPSSAFRVVGNAVVINVPGSMLPSTGLMPSQYRFNY